MPPQKRCNFTRSEEENQKGLDFRWRARLLDFLDMLILMEFMALELGMMDVMSLELRMNVRTLFLNLKEKYVV